MVLAESCMIIPIGTGLLSDFMMPFWTRNDVAPPLAIWPIISSVFSSPGIGPMASEWSMGMQSIRPFFVTRASLTCLPVTNYITLCILPSA